MQEFTQLSKLFQDSTETDQLLPAYKELLADKTAAEPLVEAALDAFIAAPANLASAEQRRCLANVFLLAGMLHDDNAYEKLQTLLNTPEFCANVDKQEWMFCELSRLLGTLSPADEAPALVKRILDSSTHANLREQYVMTLLFRWMADRDRDRNFLECIETLMAQLPKDCLNYELCMALIVNAIAAGGDNCHDEVMAFYHKNEKLFDGSMSEKALGNFFGLGKQRTKTMLRANYMGGYSEPQNEINRMLHFSAEAESEAASVAPKALPPIVRDKPKVGRNDPCPCGSGKKYKHCCGR